MPAPSLQSPRSEEGVRRGRRDEVRQHALLKEGAAAAANLKAPSHSASRLRQLASGDRGKRLDDGIQRQAATSAAGPRGLAETSRKEPLPTEGFSAKTLSFLVADDKEFDSKATAAKREAPSSITARSAAKSARSVSDSTPSQQVPATPSQQVPETAACSWGAPTTWPSFRVLANKKAAKRTLPQSSSSSSSDPVAAKQLHASTTTDKSVAAASEVSEMKSEGKPHVQRSLKSEETRIQKKNFALHFPTASESDEMECCIVYANRPGPHDKAQAQAPDEGRLAAKAAAEGKEAAASRPRAETAGRALPEGVAESAETTAVTSLSSRRVSRSTPSASSLPSPKRPLVSAGKGEAKTTQSKTAPATEFRGDAADSGEEASGDEVLVVLSDDASSQSDISLAREVQRLRGPPKGIRALLRLGKKLARRVKPVDVNVLRAVTGKDAFDILGRDERIAWLTLNYIKLLYGSKSRAGCRDGRHACIKDLSPYTVSHIVWKLGNMQSPQWMPQNIVGIGELRVPPGYRALSVGQLRAVGLHFSQTDRVSVGFDEDRMETATSVLLNDTSVEDWGTIFVLHGEDPEPGELGVFPGDQVISLGNSAQNMALYTAWKHEYPLRVVRGHTCCSRYAPEWGYRYDGLYRIVDVLIDSSDPPSLPDYKKRRSTSSSRPHLDLAVRSQPSSDWRLPGRCVFKFIFAAIHGKHYQPPESSWRTSELPEMSGDLWKTRYRLQQIRAIALRQFRQHKRAQKLLEYRSQYPFPTSRLVEVRSDLPRPFGLLVPPVLTFPSIGSILTSIGAVVANAFHIYERLRRQWGLEGKVSLNDSKGMMDACDAYSAAFRGEEENVPSWAAAGFLPAVVELTSYELHLKPLSLSERQKIIEAHIAKNLPRPAGTQRWGGRGWEGGGGGRPHMIPNGSVRRKKGALAFTLNVLERQLVRLAAKEKWQNQGHRRLEWVKTTRRLLISKQYALEFAHTVLPQSATCGIVACIRLGPPLPLDWSPWKDISQGQEVFKIPALNPVDDTPPPTDFAELPNYCDAVRDPITGRIYCAGAGQEFLKKYPLTLALCSAHCLCDSESCLNRLDEDLKFRVAVVRTRYAGWELRAMEAIPKDAYVMQYVGEVIPRALMDGRSKQVTRRGYHNYCMELVVEEKDVEFDWGVVCINSLFIGNVSRFLNHSCDPNVRVAPIWRGPELPMIGIFADKDIAAGDALTYAYGAGYEEMLCLCGAPNCKGFLGIET